MPPSVYLGHWAGFFGVMLAASWLAAFRFRLSVRALAPASKARGGRRGQAALFCWLTPLVCAALAGAGCDQAKEMIGGGPGEPADAKKDAAALSAEIDQTRARLAHLQIEFARDGAGLAAQFKALEERRKKLPSGDAAAIAAFNNDAAAYQAQNGRVRDEKTQIDACDQVLSALLSTRAKLNPPARIAAEPAAPPAQAPPPALFQPARSGPAEVVIYSATWCGYCKMAKKHLDEKGVAYDEVDIEKSPDGPAKYQALGGGGIPIIVIKGHVIRGYDPARIDALL